MEAHFASGFRQFISEHSEIRSIVDFGNFTVFPGVGTKTCVLNIEVQEGESEVANIYQTTRKNRRLANIATELNSLSMGDAFEHTTSNQAEFDEDRWVFPREIEKELIDRIDNECWPLGSRTRIGKGMETGANDVFEVNPETIDEYSKHKWK